MSVQADAGCSGIADLPLCLPQDVNPFEFLDLAIAATISQLALNGLDELTTTDRRAFGPKGLALLALSAQGLFDPFGVRGGQTRNIDLQRLGQRRAVDDAVARRSCWIS